MYPRDGDIRTTRSESSIAVLNQQAFAVEKPTQGFRVFTLGGSSVYGFPWDASVAFPAILGDLLQRAHPMLRIESINAGAMSYAMHRLELLSRELAEYDPDLVIIYSGHNEFIEPIFLDEQRRATEQWPVWKKLLSRSRIAGAVEQWSPSPLPPADPTIDEVWVRRETVAVREQERQQATQHFEARLTELVGRFQQAGSRVLVTSVPCNLRDWRPEKSLSPPGLSASQQQQLMAWQNTAAKKQAEGDWQTAVKILQSALRLAPEHAQLHYQLGQCWERLGEYEQAAAAFDRACDFDGYPIRRIRAFNVAAKQVAATTGAEFVDLDQRFRKLSPHGLIGFHFIEDYVHPSLRGHELIAQELWHAIEQQQWLGTSQWDPQLAQQVVAERRRNVTPTPNFLFNQGVVFENQGQIDRALELYEQVLAVTPHVGALGNAAKIWYQRGRLEEAKRRLQSLLEVDPEHPGAWNDLGTVQQAEGNVADAIQSHRRAIQLRGEFPAARQQLGRAYLAGGQPQEALMELQAIVAENSDASIHADLARIHRELGNQEQARAALQAAIQRAPQQAEYHNELGTLWEDANDFDAALQCYQQALAIAPENAAIRNNLGNILQRQGKPQEAIFHYRQSLQQDPNQAGVHFNLGNALQAVGRWNDAIAAFDLALQLDAGFADAWHQKGLAHAANNQLDFADSALEQAASLDPHNAEIDLARSLIARRLGQRELAEKLAISAITKDPTSGMAQFNLGELHMHARQYAPAAAAFQMASQQMPDWAPALAYWSLALSSDNRNEDQTRARQLAQRARGLSREPDPLVLFALAMAGAHDSSIGEPDLLVEEAKRLATARGDLGLVQQIEETWSANR